MLPLKKRHFIYLVHFLLPILLNAQGNTDERDIKYARVTVHASRIYNLAGTWECESGKFVDQQSFQLSAALFSGYVPYEKTGTGVALSSQFESTDAPKMEAFHGSGSGRITYSGSERFSDLRRVRNGGATAMVNTETTKLDLSWDFEQKMLTGGLNLAFDPPKSSGKLTTVTPDKTEEQDVPEAASGILSGYTMLCGAFVFQNKENPAMKPFLAQMAAADITGNLTALCRVVDFPGGFTIHLTYTGTKDEPLKPGCTGKPLTATCQTTVSIHVLLEPPPPLIARIVPLKPQDYLDYLPTGKPVHPSDPDITKPLSFKILLYEKKNPDKEVTNEYPFTVNWEILERSDYKGMCMNYPPKNANSPELKDFEWDASMAGQPEKNTISDNTASSKSGEGNTFYAILKSNDYGGWCKLSATVHLKDGGGSLLAEFKNEAGVIENFCRIPNDCNHNDIADKWEKDMDIFTLNMDADFDSDERMGQKRYGDGYTNWEEYRGFAVEDNFLEKPGHVQIRGHHVRTDPEYKDNFVYDEDGLFKKYYTRNNPSKLNWHYIKQDHMVWTQTGPAGMPDHRWVNFHFYQPYHYARQYAIHLADGKIVMSAPTNTGEALRASDFEPMIIKSIFRVEVYTTVIETWALGIGSFKWVSSGPQCTNFLDLQTHITVIHEMGHGLGIVHHFHPVSHKNEDNDNWVGIPTCCIRYGSPQETAGRGCAQQMEYCRKGQTYTIPGLAGTFQAQDCWGQIDIKSDP